MTAIAVTKLTIDAKGRIVWRYPLSVNSPTNSVVVSDSGRLNYYQFKLSGSLLLAEGQSFDLIIPMGFNISYLSPSQFRINDQTATLKLTGEVALPENLNTVSGDRLAIPFSNISNPWFFSTGQVFPSDDFFLTDNSPMKVELKELFFDFTGEESPDPFAGDPEWTGALVKEYNLSLPTEFDERERIVLASPLDWNLKFGESLYQTTYIASTGLNLDFEKAWNNSKPDATFCSFPGKMTEFKIQVLENMTTGNLNGEIAIPLLDEDNAFSFSCPIAQNGFHKGIFDRQEFSRIFNQGHPQAELTLGIKQLIFDDNESVSSTVDVDWPHLEASVGNVPDFKIYGDGETGYGERGGNAQLSNREQGKAGGFDVDISGLTATLEEGLYTLGMQGNIDLGPDIQTDISNFNIQAATQAGGQVAEGQVENIAGQLQDSRFNIDDFAFRLNLLGIIDVDLMMHYVMDDPDFGDRFEARGEILITMPKKIYGLGRFVIANDDDVEFWYARVSQKLLTNPSPPTSS